MKKITILAVASCLAFGACKKDDNNSGGTKTENLQNGKWLMTSAKVSFALGEQELMDNLDACQKDNLYIFNSDKTITADAGATKCNPSEKQETTDGNWELRANDTKLKIGGSTITQGMGDLEGEILQLDANTLKVKKDTTMGTLAAVITVTFANKK